MGGLVQPGTPARSPRLRSTRRVRGRPHRHLTHCESANPGPRNRLGTKPGVLHAAPSISSTTPIPHRHRCVVSPRTVQTHLTHVYTKLGLTSRVQLVQEAAR